jgi:hypothetical protein
MGPAFNRFRSGYMFYICSTGLQVVLGVKHESQAARASREIADAKGTRQWLTVVKPARGPGSVASKGLRTGKLRPAETRTVSGSDLEQRPRRGGGKGRSKK